jgi:hypothetical protein
LQRTSGGGIVTGESVESQASVNGRTQAVRKLTSLQLTTVE